MSQATVTITFNTSMVEALALAQTLQCVERVEAVQEVQATLVEAPAQPPASTTAPVEIITGLHITMDMLDDDRFTLRTLTAVMRASGYTDANNLIDDLSNATGNCIVRLNRRSDGAPMIGWAHRN